MSSALGISKGRCGPPVASLTVFLHQDLHFMYCTDMAAPRSRYLKPLIFLPRICQAALALTKLSLASTQPFLLVSKNVYVS